MKLEKSVHGDEVRFDVYEDISNYQDIVSIKSTLQNSVVINPEKTVSVVIHDAMSLPSSIIGSLLEFIEIQKIKLSVKVARDELYNSLKKLTLLEILNVTRK